MTRNELRAKLADLDVGVRAAEAEIVKLWRREEHIRTLERGDEGLLALRRARAPGVRERLPRGEAPPYQLLRVEIRVPEEGEVTIRVPYLPDDAYSCREEIADDPDYNTMQCLDSAQ